MSKIMWTDNLALREVVVQGDRKYLHTKDNALRSDEIVNPWHGKYLTRQSQSRAKAKTSRQTGQSSGHWERTRFFFLLLLLFLELACLN